MVLGVLKLCLVDILHKFIMSIHKMYVLYLGEKSAFCTMFFIFKHFMDCEFEMFQPGFLLSELLNFYKHCRSTGYYSVD